MGEYDKYDKYVAYWLRLVDNDLLTLDALMEKSRYLHALVFCQQVCKKILKGLYAQKVDKIPPYTHGLLFLVNRIGLSVDDNQAEKLDELEYFYFESRYPADVSRITDIDSETAKRYYDFTKDFQEWVRNLLT